MPVEHDSFRESPSTREPGFSGAKFRWPKMSRWRSATTRCTTSSPIAGQLAGALATARRNASRALTSRGAAVLLTKQSQISVSFQRRLGSKSPDLCSPDK